MSLMRLQCAAFVICWALLLGFSVAKQDARRAAQTALFQIHSDPEAAQDSYLHLSQRDRDEWSRSSHWTAQEMEEQLTNMELQVSVEIRLVGFDGEGNMQLGVSEEDLRQYLGSMFSSSPVFVLDGDSNTTQSLGIGVSYRFYVTKAPRHLADELEGALHRAVASSMAGTSGLQDGTPALVSYELTDAVIRRDVQQQHSGRITIYVLNPEPPGQRYLYHYPDKAACPGTLWQGHQRYLWIDLSAGPAEYGPASSGPGLVLEHTVPQLKRYRRLEHRRMLLADLAALVSSAAAHLLSPPLTHLPPWQWRELEVVVVVMYDMKEGGSRVVDELLDLNVLTTQLQQLAHNGQKVSVTSKALPLGVCPQCVAAYSMAAKSRTGRVPGPGFQVMSHAFLDGTELRHWLAQFSSSILQKAGAAASVAEAQAKRSTRLLPVFLYAVDSMDELLLDDIRPVRAFPDLVVGVGSKAEWAMTDLQCGGVPVVEDPRDLTRSVLAALLQTGWGVGAPELIWSPAGDVRSNYLWSVGHNPFGALARTASMSFAQRDAARRNMLLAAINSTATDAARLLRGFRQLHPPSAPDGGGRAWLHVVPPAHRAAFVGRVNVLHFKLSKALHQLGLLGFASAQYYALSARHDLAALQRLTASVAASVRPVVRCTAHSQLAAVASGLLVSGFFLAVIGCALVTAAMLAMRRRAAIAASKRKIF